MANATDISGTVFKNGSATLLARVVGADGTPVTQASIASAVYSIELLDENDPDAGTAVAGHSDVAVGVAALIYDTLQTDALWDVDSTGYNLKHVLDVFVNPAFAVAGRQYRITFRLTPTAGQVILVRFRVQVI